ncbi:MAG: phage holin family protein [Deltaproteobacteria bacterium]|nr:phage holin family protein [Deltaproteobacteria bacterium]MCW5808754.1 phage holin family protein [Deltaproteobacteria bacterium]
MDTTTQQDHKLATVMREVARDLKTIATDEIELGQHALADHLGRMFTKAALALLGAIVALFGMAMLCTAGVVALAPAIPQLWLRLLLGAAVYLAIGAGATVFFSRRIAREARTTLATPAHEFADTVDAIQKGLSH